VPASLLTDLSRREVTCPAIIEHCEIMTQMRGFKAVSVAAFHIKGTFYVVLKRDFPVAYAQDSTYLLALRHIRMRV